MDSLILTNMFHRPARTSPGAVWRQHVGFGLAFYDIYYRYREFMPFSQSIWASQHLPAPLAAAAHVVIAVAFVLRLFVQRPQLRRFWFAIPGMIWAQLALYYGMLQAASQVLAPPVP